MSAIVGLYRVTRPTGKLTPPAPVPTATFMPTLTPFLTLTPIPTMIPTATPTPLQQLMPGGQAIVQGTGEQQLRLRAAPGLDKEILRTLPDETRLKILEGPEVADGYKWWKVQTDDGLVGWAAGDWLVPTAP
ncbi:MAG: SH3 domain-containing protein [Anaerolineae bacterium]